MWHGRHGTLVVVSMVAASGLSGAQCQGLVGPKMPTVGVPMAAETWTRPEVVGDASAGAFQRQDGVAEVRRGEVAGGGTCGADDLGGERCLGLAAEHPDRVARGGELFRQVAEVAPALARADRAGRECDDRMAVVRPAPALNAPVAVASAAGTFSSGFGHSIGGAAAFGSASVPQRSIMRGSAFSP